MCFVKIVIKFQYIFTTCFRLSFDYLLLHKKPPQDLLSPQTLWIRNSNRAHWGWLVCFRMSRASSGKTWTTGRDLEEQNRENKLLCLFLQGHWSIITIWLPPQGPPPNTVTWGVRISIYEFWGYTNIQSLTYGGLEPQEQMFQPTRQKLNGPLWLASIILCVEGVINPLVFKGREYTLRISMGRESVHLSDDPTFKRFIH